MFSNVLNFLDIGTRGFGVMYVNGFNLLPAPAANTTTSIIVMHL